MNLTSRTRMLALAALLAGCREYMSPTEKCHYKFIEHGRGAPQENYENFDNCLARVDVNRERRRAKARGELPPPGPGFFGTLFGRRQQTVVVNQSATLVAPQPVYAVPTPAVATAPAPIPATAGGEAYDCTPAEGGALTCVRRPAAPAAPAPAPIPSTVAVHPSPQPERIWGKPTAPTASALPSPR